MAESVQAGLLVGERLGKFEMLALLAIGGTAEIYLARIGGESGFEKYVVVKCLLDHLADDAEFVRMFLDEARLGAQLDHSNIVQTLELGEHKNRYYMVMEYLAGMSLAQLARKTQERVVGGLMPIDLVLGLAAQACAGLHYAHERSMSDGKQLNIVHRDVSPQNLVVSFDGVLKIVDFGIAKADHRQTNTRSGTIKGKFAYMSPEQCLAKPIDRRTDIFALGVIVHELLTARRLFKRATTYETYQAIVNGNVPPPSQVNHELDPSLDEVVMRALCYDRDQRYPTAEAFGEALLGVLHRRGRSVSATDIAHYYEQHFGTELNEHGMRMRELINGSGRSIEMTWDSGAEEREEPAVVVQAPIQPPHDDSLEEEIAAMLETSIRDVTSERSHHDTEGAEDFDEATRVEFNPMMFDSMGESVDVALDSAVRDPASAAAAGKAPTTSAPGPAGKPPLGPGGKQTMLRLPAVLPPAAPRPVGPAPAGSKPGGRTLGPTAAILPPVSKPLPSVLDRGARPAPTAPARTRPPAARGQTPPPARSPMHAPLPVSEPVSENDEQRPTVTLTPKRPSEENELAPERQRADVSAEARTEPVGTRDGQAAPAGKAGVRRKSTEAIASPFRSETIRGQAVSSVMPRAAPEDVATKTESPGAMSNTPPPQSGHHPGDRRTLFAPGGAPVMTPPGSPAGNGQIARGAPSYGPPPSLGTDPGPDAAGPRPQSIPPDTLPGPHPQDLDAPLEGEIVALGESAQGFAELPQRDRSGTDPGLPPDMPDVPSGLPPLYGEPDRGAHNAPTWMLPQPLAAASNQPGGYPSQPMIHPPPTSGSGSNQAMPRPVSQQSSQDYVLPPEYQMPPEYPMPQAQAMPPGHAMPQGHAMPPGQASPIYPQVQRDAFLSPGGSIVSSSALPTMHSDLGRLQQESDRRPLWITVVAFLIAFGIGLGATVGIANLIN